MFSLILLFGGIAILVILVIRDEVPRPKKHKVTTTTHTVMTLAQLHCRDCGSTNIGALPAPTQKQESHQSPMLRIVRDNGFYDQDKQNC